MDASFQGDNIQGDFKVTKGYPENNCVENSMFSTVRVEFLKTKKRSQEKYLKPSFAKFIIDMEINIPFTKRINQWFRQLIRCRDFTVIIHRLCVFIESTPDVIITLLSHIFRPIVGFVWNNKRSVASDAFEN